MVVTKWVKIIVTWDDGICNVFLGSESLESDRGAPANAHLATKILSQEQVGNVDSQFAIERYPTPTEGGREAREVNSESLHWCSTKMRTPFNHWGAVHTRVSANCLPQCEAAGNLQQERSYPSSFR